MNSLKTNCGPQILPGLKPALELLAESPRLIAKIYCRDGKRGQGIAKLAALCRQNSVKLEFVDAHTISALCKKAPSHQGIVTLLDEVLPVPLEGLLGQNAPLPLLIALDQVQDPGNLGTICRTAWAFGCAGLVLPRHGAALFGPAAAKASAGAIARLPICIATNLARALDSAEEAGFAIYGTSCDKVGNADAFKFAWQLPAVLVLGNEDHGIRPGIAKRCQAMLTIPLGRAFNSLNVAQAGAILIALCARQHGCPY